MAKSAIGKATEHRLAKLEAESKLRKRTCSCCGFSPGEKADDEDDADFIGLILELCSDPACGCKGAEKDPPGRGKSKRPSLVSFDPVLHDDYTNPDRTYDAEPCPKCGRWPHLVCGYCKREYPSAPTPVLRAGGGEWNRYPPYE